MYLPALLTAKDSVAFVAPARKVSEAEMAPSIAILQRCEFNVITSKNFYGISRQYSGTDEERLADLQWALDHPGIKAIFCARGGYGTLRILDRLKWEGFEKHPKWIVGYSDVTVLHAELSRRGFASIHGNMLINFSKYPQSTDSLLKILGGAKPEYHVPVHPLQKPGNASGILTGGNLSLLYALQGSASFPETKGRILFLEDLDEYLYHIDRMMLSLKRSGALRNLAGLVIGGMTEMKDNAVPFGSTAEEIIAEAVSGYGYPVCFGFPAGHIPENMALKLGAEVSLETGSGGSTLKFLQ